MSQTNSQQFLKHDMDKALESFIRYTERKAFYYSFGYDIDQERNFIINQAQPIKGKILEVGTGKGYFTIALAQKGHCFTTYDISSAEQEYALFNLKHLGLENRIDFRIGDGENLGFLNSSYDVIFSVNTLHHLKNPFQVMNEFIRILSPMGKIVISDFTAKGFDIVEKIHVSEGKHHEVCSTTINDVMIFLMNRGFKTRLTSSPFQDVLIGVMEK